MSTDPPEDSKRDWIAEIESKQKNVIWPDPLRNSQAVDRLLWRGSSKTTAVQRIGILLFGLTFLGMSALFVFIGIQKQ